MLSKKVIKDIESLHLKKYREETGLFVAEGPKLVEELIAEMPESIVQVYATEDWLKANSKTEVVTEAELQKLSSLKTANQVVAVVKQKEAIEPAAKDFSLYLDTIQDPGNLGTIVRIADWFGIKNIVCSAGCVDLYNPKVVQSTMASIARVNVFYEEEEGWLAKQTVPVYAASLHGENLYSFPKTTIGILLIGNESKGVRKEFLDRATHSITIPRKGRAESLNAAVATGILLSHLLG